MPDATSCDCGTETGLSTASEMVHHLLRVVLGCGYSAATLRPIRITAPRVVPGGIERGGIFTIGGIPGDGKTAIATHLVAKALDAGRNVHFVTLEMTRAALVRRILKAYWGKTQEEIDKDIDSAVEMAGTLTVSNTLVRLPDVIGSMGRHADADLIFVDYAQRIREDNYRDNRVAETESVYGTLANFAREFEVPLVVLSQLNRDYKSDKAEPPQMYHMKGSGAIEADSHVGVFSTTRTARRSNRRAWWRRTADGTRNEFSSFARTAMAVSVRFGSCSTRSSPCLSKTISTPTDREALPSSPHWPRHRRGNRRQTRCGEAKASGEAMPRDWGLRLPKVRQGLIQSGKDQSQKETAWISHLR